LTIVGGPLHPAIELKQVKPRSTVEWQATFLPLLLRVQLLLELFDSLLPL
jgi:hypothetical protein